MEGAGRPREADEPLSEMTVVPEQSLIPVTCRDQRQQVALLERWRGERVECKALMG